MKSTMNSFMKLIAKGMLAFILLESIFQGYPALGIAGRVSEARALAAAKAPERSFEVEKAKQEPEKAQPTRQTTELIVVYKKGKEKTQADLNQTAKKAKVEKLTKKRELESRVDLLNVGSKADMATVMEVLRADPNVESVQPNYSFEISAVPSDPEFGLQWGLENSGQVIQDVVGAAGIDIRASAAWDEVSSQGSVIVAVLDTGIDTQHPDLQGQLMGGWNFVGNNGNVNPTDGAIHGTQIAGILGANANSQGVRGVAQNVTIMPLKFIENGIGYTSELLEAIAYAEANGATIVNCSFGGYQYNPALYEAMKNSSMLFVCAAGNASSTQSMYPAGFSLPNVISVGGVDQSGKLWEHSNYGLNVDFAAPAENIYSTQPNNTYGFQSGTSMAAAFVSGVAAMVVGENPGLTAEQQKYVLLSTAQRMERLQGQVYIGGMVDAEAAVEAVKNGKPVTVVPLRPDHGKAPEILPGALELLDQKAAYRNLTNDEKAFFCEQFQVRDDILAQCDQKGYNLQDALSMAQDVGKYGLTVDQLAAYLATRSGEADLYRELDSLASTLQKYNLFGDIADAMKAWVLSGVPAYRVKNAQVLAEALELGIDDIVAQTDMDITQADWNRYAFSQTEKDAFIGLAAGFQVNLAALLDYAAEEGKTCQEMIDRIADYQVNHDARRSDGYVPLSAGSDVKKYPLAPFAFRSGQQENVNANTGALTYDIQDVALKGRNGLDLNLGLHFDSSKTNTADVTVEWEYVLRQQSFLVYPVYFKEQYWLSYNNGSNITKTTTYSGPIAAFYTYMDARAFASTVSIDYGWTPVGSDKKERTYISADADYASPYYVTDSWYEYVPITAVSGATYDSNSQLGLGWTLNLPSIETDGGNRYLHINGSSYKIKSGFSSGDSNLEEYTTLDMQIMTDNGSYSNGTMSSSFVLNFKDGRKDYFAADGRLLGTRDRFGNTIKYEHEMVNSKPLVSKITDTVGREVLIQRTTSGNNKLVTIVLPDGETIQYILTPAAGQAGKHVLSKRIDQKGRETSFTYNIVASKSDYVNSKLSQYVVTYKANLTKVEYPTGGETNYTYAKALKHVGSTSVSEVFRVTSRFEGTSAAPLNKQTFSYGANSLAYLYAGQTYNVTISEEATGKQTVITFNDKHLALNETTKDGGVTAQTVATQYNAIKQPVEKTTRTFSGSSFTESVETFEYNTHSDILAYWGPLTTVTNGVKSDTYKTAYTYNAAYHYPLTREYKRDATHTLREEWIPSADSKTVTQSDVYENNVLKQRTGYLHDAYGNVVEERRYKEGWVAYETTQISYADNAARPAGVDFAGLYPTKVSQLGVEDAGGSLVAALSGDQPGEISQTTQYDIMGSVVAKRDANGNTTLSEYDVLGRATKATHPDGTFATQTYNDTLNTLVQTDERGTQTRYEYDAYGNLLAIVDVATGEYLQRFVYDGWSRLAEENNHNSSAQSQAVRYTYDALGRLLEKQTVDAQNTLLAQENYAYTEGLESGALRKVTKTVLGDASSPSIVTSQYFNKMGWVARQGRVKDSIEYTDSFFYDYLGNKVGERSARAGYETYPEMMTMAYEYDFGNRVVSATNIMNGAMATAYDALGNKVSVTDPSGTVSAYAYDGLGRLLAETLPMTGSENVVKTYAYDRNGNVLRETHTNGLASYW